MHVASGYDLKIFLCNFIWSVRELAYLCGHVQTQIYPFIDILHAYISPYPVLFVIFFIGPRRTTTHTITDQSISMDESGVGESGGGRDICDSLNSSLFFAMVVEV